MYEIQHTDWIDGGGVRIGLAPLSIALDSAILLCSVTLEARNPSARVVVQSLRGKTLVLSSSVLNSSLGLQRRFASQG